MVVVFPFASVGHSHRITRLLIANSFDSNKSGAAWVAVSIVETLRMAGVYGISGNPVCRQDNPLTGPADTGQTAPRHSNKHRPASCLARSLPAVRSSHPKSAQRHRRLKPAAQIRFALPLGV